VSKKGYLVSPVAIILFFTMIITISGCYQETEQGKVKKVITDIQRSAEERDIKKIITSLSKTYNDPQGFNYDTMKGLLLGYFIHYPNISATITNLEIYVENTSAKALFQAVLTGRIETGPAVQLIPESLGMYVFDVSLRKEPDGWKITSAKWERVGDGAVGGGR